MKRRPAPPRLGSHREDPAGPLRWPGGAGGDPAPLGPGSGAGQGGMWGPSAPPPSPLRPRGVGCVA
eukprot:7472630-Alexandrium_andersonii.AAC.1